MGKLKDSEIKELLESLTIIVDTREKDTAIEDWLNKKGKQTIRRKLDYGDFSFYLPRNKELEIYEDIYFDYEIVIERKNSLEEIIGNLCEESGRRLEKELKNCPAKMTIVIEDTFDRACLGTYRSNYNRKSLIGKIMTFEHKYNVPVRFRSKESMPVFIYYYFYYYLRNHLKNLDD